MLWPGSVSGHEGQADESFQCSRQLDLGLFRGFREALQRLAILTQIDSLIAEKFFGDPIHQAFVKIVSAQVRVAGRGMYFEHAVADVEYGNVKRAAAEVKNQDGFVGLLV